MEQIYINIQTKEVLDMNKANKLVDNAMLKVRPDLFNEWDFEKNNELDLDIYKLTKGSKKKPNWICFKCKSSYDTVIYSRVFGVNCPYCVGQKVNHTNSLASLNQELAKEWHPTLNGNLTPHHVTCGKRLKVWWKCQKCKSNYEMRINHRVSGSKCSYCAGQKVNETNSLATLRPELASEWHPTKNTKSAQDVTISHGKKVWWLGKCGHEWETTVAIRNNGSDCPYCSKYKADILVGFNDLWTTHPHMAKLLLNPSDGYKYSYGSEKRLDWKCADCNCEILNKVTNSVVKNGLSCIRCSDGFPYTEKFMFNFLKTINVGFKWELTFSWSNNKRYDFYLPKYNMIIEAHGRQHSETPFTYSGSRSLIEEQVNDRYKHVMALHNGIEKYIAIDCRYSELEWIKNSILKSELATMFDLSRIDWEYIDKLSRSSIFMKVIHKWNDNHSIDSISEELKIDQSTVRRYLKRGSNSSLCDYTTRVRKVVQLKDNKLITTYDNCKLASNAMGFVRGDKIAHCCKGLIKTAYGYSWMYKDDYDKLIKSK